MQLRNQIAQTVTAIAGGYALGMIPSADLAARWASSGSTNLRDTGSANPGALNATKTFGKKWGGAVLAADVAKGLGASVMGRMLGGATGANLAATGAVAGHCYPLGRSGGKGISTSIGQVIGTFPTYLPLDIAVAATTAMIPKWTQRTWAATALASTTWVTSAVVAYRKGWPTGIDRQAPLALPIAAAASSAVIAKRFLDSPLVEGKPRSDGRVDPVGAQRADARDGAQG